MRRSDIYASFVVLACVAALIFHAARGLTAQPSKAPSERTSTARTIEPSKTSPTQVPTGLRRSATEFLQDLYTVRVDDTEDFRREQLTAYLGSVMAPAALREIERKIYEDAQRVRKSGVTVSLKGNPDSLRMRPLPEKQDTTRKAIRLSGRVTVRDSSHKIIRRYTVRMNSVWMQDQHAWFVINFTLRR
jgi:hypothetical protein